MTDIRRSIKSVPVTDIRRSDAYERRRRIKSVRMGPRRPGRLMYQCQACRRWTYNLPAHLCGKRMDYPRGFGR